MQAAQSLTSLGQTRPGAVSEKRDGRLLRAHRERPRRRRAAEQRDELAPSLDHRHQQSRPRDRRRGAAHGGGLRRQAPRGLSLKCLSTELISGGATWQSWVKPVTVSSLNSAACCPTELTCPIISARGVVCCSHPHGGLEAQRTCREHRERTDAARLTQLRHQCAIFAVMHSGVPAQRCGNVRP
jgi:hypothetical protein